MKDRNSAEEIDLLPIFKSLQNSFLKLIRLFTHFIQFSLKNIKVLLIFSIIGIGFSGGLFFMKKKVYVSDLTLSHIRLNNGECYALINALSDLRANSNINNDRILSRKLNISIPATRQIKSVTCKALNESLEKKYKDSAFVLLPFKIEVGVYDPTILDSLQMGIMNYLESNEYAAKRKKIQLDYLGKFQDKIKGEIIAIDSLKQLVNKSIIPRGSGNGIILGEPIDPVKVYQSGLELYKSQLRLSEQLELNNSFEVLIGFSPAVPAAKLPIYFLGGLITGLIAGLLFLGIRKRDN